MGATAKQIFVNLPVKDLNATMEFFAKAGFAFNPQFTDQNAACMIIGENSYVMLLVEAFFKTFTKKDIIDPTTGTEMIIALSVESKEQVDELVSKALAAGGKTFNDPVSHGDFMYTWSFQDLDGHLWEVLYMNESAVNQE